MNEPDFWKKLFTPGTPQCTIASMVAAVLVALMLLLIGFWKTLLIVALVAVGLFVGGVEDKQAFFRRILEKFSK